MTKNDEIRGETAYFMRRLYEQRLTTTSGGNISVKDGGTVYITPSALDKGRISAAQIAVMTVAGEMLSDHKPSIETQMHLAIYKARPEINAVVHAHPVTVSVYAAAKRKINTSLLAESYAILGELAYADYHCIGTSELANAVAAAVMNANCVIMHQHGALAVGKSLLEAFDRIEVLENAAKINLMCRLAWGSKMKPISARNLSDLDSLMGR
jgi:L-fuculose-phosphate aldolase